MDSRQGHSIVGDVRCREFAIWDIRKMEGEIWEYRTGDGWVVGQVIKEKQ